MTKPDGKFTPLPSLRRHVCWGGRDQGTRSQPGVFRLPRQWLVLSPACSAVSHRLEMQRRVSCGNAFSGALYVRPVLV